MTSAGTISLQALFTNLKVLTLRPQGSFLHRSFLLQKYDFIIEHSTENDERRRRLEVAAYRRDRFNGMLTSDKASRALFRPALGLQAMLPEARSRIITRGAQTVCWG